MKCQNCGYHPAAEEEEFRSGGGWDVDHSWDGGVQIEEYRCPVCGDLVNREETGSRDVFPDGGSWFSCACGARYRNRAAALRCCDDRFGGDR